MSLLPHKSELQTQGIALESPPLHITNTETAVCRCSIKLMFLKNFAKFTGKHLCHSLFFNKVAGLRPETLLKERFQHKYFPVSSAKFLAASFLQTTFGGCFCQW